MMKIYDREGFPNPSRIRIVIAEKRLEERIEFVSVDLIGAEHKQARFVALNPTGKVPVLELEGGLLLSESTAITTYLDMLDGHPTLTGSTPREKAIILMMQRRAESELLEAIDGYFHFGTPGLGDAMIPYTSPEWSGRSEWGRRQGEKAVQAMAYFNTLLDTRPFIAGDHFSMADITVFAALNFAEAAGLPIASEWTALTAWRATVSDLPSVKNRSGQNFLPEDLRRFGL